jgi:hypothetical protein
MKLRGAALVVVLALGVLVSRDLPAQTSDPGPGRARAQGELGQNYPNPFDIDTRIPFVVGAPPECREPGRLHRVTVRVYNILLQLVAVPVLQGGGGSVADGQPLENVLLPCDKYVAYWNGKLINTVRDAAAGVYIYQLEIDGRPVDVKRLRLVR